MSESTAERFVDAIAQHDRAGLVRLLHPEVDFRGLTPRRFWEAGDPEGVVEVVLDHWFADSDRIEAVTSIEHGAPVGDIRRIGYRFDLRNSDGPATVEQQAYYAETAGLMTYLRVVCSGFRPRLSSRLLQ